MPALSTPSSSTSAELGDRLAEVIEAVHGLGLECVLAVRDEDELEEVLELFDPEILLLSAEEADDGQHHLDRLLELLPDVPAGKLAIAELAGASRAEVSSSSVPASTPLSSPARHRAARR